MRRTARLGGGFRSAGFTLVELMVVIAVIAVLAGVAVPGLSNTIEKNDLKNRARALSSALNAARMEAVKRGTEIAVCVSNDGATCTDDAWEDGWVVRVTASGTVLHTIADDGSDTAVSATNSVGQVLYQGGGRALFAQADGTATAANLVAQTFTVATDCWSKGLVIEATGRIDNSATPAYTC